jgi:acetylornithine deacetylase/succinyl-diaminopimelate desuccinylase-like protein
VGVGRKSSARAGWAGSTNNDRLARSAPSSKWNFSTNGIYWAGKAGIPSIGFGPGDEETAHTVNDSVSLEDMVKATEFYAILPSLIKGN